MLKNDRFETFVLSMDSIHKSINRIKQEIISDTVLKGVHTLWLYELLKCPLGLTAAQLAAESNIDRSLVSREVNFLVENGYITLAEGKKKRGYNVRLQLTDLGRSVAQKISSSALAVQMCAGEGISREDIEVFYRVLSRISENLEGLCRCGLEDADSSDAAAQ